MVQQSNMEKRRRINYLTEVIHCNSVTHSESHCVTHAVWTENITCYDLRV